MEKRNLCIALLAALSLTAAAKPASGLRCNGKIIDSGVTKAEVREACGEPTCIRKPPTTLVRKAGVYWPIASDQEWVYNFGPQRFIQFIRFYQGEVVFVQSGGYGWTGERDCKDIPEE